MSIRYVLITGASTGIGAACVEALKARGFGVIAGLRNSGASGADVETVRLDVTDEEQIRAAAERVRQITGGQGLYGLVNNAGIAISAPIEMIALPLLRKQLEVNVVGQVAVTQAMLPMLRDARGRVVNIGSIAGLGTSPMGGPYSASKFALEAITDALRMEVKHWGIEVSIVEPGPIQTPIWTKGKAIAEEALAESDPDIAKLYSKVIDALRSRLAKIEEKAIPASKVSDAVVHALTSSRPRTRYLVGRDAKLRAMLTKLPDRVQDSIILRALGLN